MLVLALAAIALGGTAVSWVNGRRTQKVQQDIDQLTVEHNELVAEAQTITSAENDERWRLVRPYVTDLLDRAREEASWRTQALRELNAAVAPATRRLGSSETEFTPGFFAKVVFNLQLETARLGAEVAHLNRVVEALGQQVRDENPSVPSPSVLVCPSDAPHDGALVQLDDGQTTLHGYRVTIDAPPDAPGRLLALYNVNHGAQTARACPVRGALLAAALQDGGGLDAEVTGMREQGLVAGLSSVSFYVQHIPGRMESRLPGDTITVYPADWTLAQILDAPLPSSPPLPASVTPRVTSRPSDWSPVPVRVPEEIMATLVSAWNDVDEDLTDDPWSVEADGDHVLFSLGPLTLRLAIDPDAQCFQLVGVEEAHASSAFAIPVGTELDVFTPGNRKDPAIAKAPFASFIDALAGELQSHRTQTLRRQGAIELRELVSVYDDQMQAEVEDSAAPLYVLRTESRRHQAILEAVLLGDHEPPWLAQCLETKRPRSVKAVAGPHEYEVSALTPLPELGDRGVRIKVELPPGAPNLDPNDVTSIVNASAGYQQRIRAQALDASFSEYESAGVRRALLAADAEATEHGAEGSGPVYDAVARSEDVFAVWGPPGTGKTTLIVRLIADAFAEADAAGRPLNVLVTAPTHVAVDEILDRLLKEVPALRDRTARYGSKEKVADTPLGDVWNEAIIDAAQESVPPLGSDPLADRWRSLSTPQYTPPAVARWILRGRAVHGATCIGMVRRSFALTDQSFDLAIVDEAGKAFLSGLLVPSRHARRVVLVGDHRQLPPTVTQEVLDDRIGYRIGVERVRELLTTNAFNRLFDRLPPGRKGMLNVQYRMDPAIGGAVSELFYGGRLSSGRSSNPWPWSEKRIHVLDFSDSRPYRNERTPSGSQENTVEAEVLRDLVRQLADLSGDAFPETLVICPYAGQRALVSQVLKKAGLLDAVEVTTVDAVQGGEADLVFLLMTRSRGRADFLLDEHRLNVALSRAKEAVVVLADVDYLRAGRPDGFEGANAFERLVDHGEREGTVRMFRLPAEPYPRDIEGFWSPQ